MKKYLILIPLVFFSLQGLTQPKFEKEERMNERDVPEIARSFIDSMNLGRKVRWYRETGLNKTSLEAKTKYKGKRISIEFSEDGAFEDVEIEIKPDEIHPDVYSRITEYLQSRHDNFSVQKIQIQYSGNRTLVLQYFLDGQRKNGLEIHYEVVLATRQERSFVMLEYLFSENGNYIQSSLIMPKNTVNLEY